MIYFAFIGLSSVMLRGFWHFFLHITQKDLKWLQGGGGGWGGVGGGGGGGGGVGGGGGGDGGGGGGVLGVVCEDDSIGVIAP